MGSGDGPPGAHVDGEVVGEVGQGGGIGVLEGVPDDGLGGGDDPMVSGELLDVLLSLFLVLTRLETLVYAGVCGVNVLHGIIVTLLSVLPVIGHSSHRVRVEGGVSAREPL